MEPENTYSVAVAAVIVDDQGRALLVQRRENGQWEPPGGLLEHGETIIDGLRRELREETGLEIEPGPLTGVYQNMRTNTVALTFRCQATGGQLTPSDETTDFCWATAIEIPALVTDVFAARILDGLAPLLRPALRVHDGIHLLD